MSQLRMRLCAFASLTPLLILCGLLFLLSLASGVALADTRTVCPSGCDDTTIQAAVNAAHAGDTIQVGSGTYTENVTVTQSLTLRGAGAANTIVDGRNADHVFNITADAVSISDLTIQNGAAIGDGGGLYARGALALTGADVLSNTATHGGGVYAGGAALVSGGRFENNAGMQGGGLYAGSSLTLTDAQFVRNSASLFYEGGGVYAAGVATLSGGLFEGNTAGWGGGLYAASALTLTSTRFTGNHAPTNLLGNAGVGGGVHANGAATLLGARLEGNAAGTNGGGLYAGGAVTLFGGRFVGNSAGGIGGGGGIYAADSLALMDTQFISNTASYEEGGGLVVYGAATLTGGFFEGNSAGWGGGVAGGWSSTLVLTDTQFVSNNALHDGGGLAASGTATLAGGRFEDNSAGENGGGLRAGAPLRLTGTRFISNTAAGNPRLRQGGGGLYAGSTAMLTDAQFIGNTAGNGGGLHANGPLWLMGTQFIGNAATNNGGAVYATGAATFSGGRFENNSAGDGGGGAFAQSALTLMDTQFIGNSAIYVGGGVHVVGAATFSGGRFESNAAGGYGGGVCADQAMTVRVTQFISNTAVIGGGVYAWATLTLTDTQFIANVAPHGAALTADLSDGSAGRIANGLFARNAAAPGGAVIALMTDPSSGAAGSMQILYTTIASPTLSTSTAISATRGALDVVDTLVASYTVGIDCAGATGTEGWNLFQGVLTPTQGATNIGPDPIGEANFRDPWADDYHLRVPSAAIDQGADYGTYTDLEGTPRPQGAGFDIGAFESYAPRLVLSKNDGMESAFAGWNQHYTLIVTNISSIPAGDVLIRDMLPAGMYVYDVSSGGQVQPDGNLAWPIGALGAHASVTVDFWARTLTTIRGPITNTATATCDLGDPATVTATDMTVILAAPAPTETPTHTPSRTPLPTPTWTATPTGTPVPTLTETSTPIPTVPTVVSPTATSSPGPPTPTPWPTDLPMPSVTPTPADLLLTGEVYTSQGLRQATEVRVPVAGARVVAILACVPRTFEALSDGAGAYTLRIPAAYAHACATLTMEVTAPGYAPFRQDYALSDLWSNPVVDVPLAPTPIRAWLPLVGH